MKTLLTFAFYLLLTAAVSAQSYIYQSGNITPGHVPAWIANGIIGDGGTAAQGNITSLGITNNGGQGECISSGKNPSPFNQLCFGVSTSAPATISLQNYGGAPAETLNIIINGQTYPFPGALSSITIGDALNGGSVGDCLIVATGPTLNQQSCSASYTQVSNWAYNVNMWGDSLTQGSQDSTGTTVCTALQPQAGYVCNNFGLGGQTSTQIAARQGSYPTSVTVSSNQLVNGSNTVTLISPLLLNNSAGSANSLTGTLCGVHGTLAQSSGSYTFTVSVGSTVPCSAASVITLDNDALWPQPVIIWSGRNNYSSESQVLSDIAGMVASLGTNNYIVLSVLNGNYPSEYSGQSGYNQIIALNTALASAYGPHYLDVREYLVGLYNPANGADVVNFGEDVPPFTLRAVDQSGTIAAGLNNSATSFTLSAVTAAGTVLTVDSEYILVNAVNSGNNAIVTSATRGYGSTSAASHSMGVSYVGTDPVHLSGAGYTDVANYIYSHIVELGQTTLPISTNNAAYTISRATQFALGGPVTFNNSLYGPNTIAGLQVINNANIESGLFTTADVGTTTTTASGAINNTNNNITITVGSTSGWPVIGYLKTPEQYPEYMAYSVQSGTSLNITSRGVFGTTAASHSGVVTISYALDIKYSTTAAYPFFSVWSDGSSYSSGSTSVGAAGSQVSYTPTSLQTPFIYSTGSNILLENAANTGFGLLQLGGTTSSFPAIKRNGTALNLVLADNSAAASITAASGSFSNLIESGNLAASSWTTNGIRNSFAPADYNDTSSSGTVAAAYTDLFGAGTITAGSATTYTNYYGSYFQAPIASVNVTFTHSYALGADSINATTIYQGGTAIASTFAPLASPTFTGTFNVNGISGAGAASKYVCVDSSGNMLTQSGTC